MMDLKRLSHFSAVFEHRSFAAAADVLDLTPQALSSSVAKLETQIGVKLFDRGPGGRTTPTEFAQVLIKHAKSQMAGAERALAEIHALRDATGGVVTIAAGTVLAAHVVPLAIQRLAAARPDVRINIVEGYTEHLLDRMKSGEVDLVAGAIPHTWHLDPELEHRFIVEAGDTVTVRTAHPLASKPQVSMADLADQTWMVPLSDEESQRLVVDMYLSAGMAPPKRFVYSDTISVGAQLLLNNDYALFTPPGVIGWGYEQGWFKSLDLPVGARKHRAYLSQRKGVSLSPAAQALADEIVVASEEVFGPTADVADIRLGKVS